MEKDRERERLKVIAEIYMGMKTMAMAYKASLGSMRVHATTNHATVSLGLLGFHSELEIIVLHMGTPWRCGWSHG